MEKSPFPATPKANADISSLPAPQIGHLELIRESLVAVVNEMRANLIHSSYSSIIYEGHDFSCALISAEGALVAQSIADHPIHIFAVPYSAVEILKAFGDDIHDGDIFLHNDPYTGGTHLNDILMLYPIFDKSKLAMFAATRCHWGDVGGMTHGSLSGRVREIYQEGIRITPTRICSRGEMNEAFLTLMFDNMRHPDERRGDFNAMLGTSRKAGQHVKRLFSRFGGAELLRGVDELIYRSEQVMRGRIQAIPDGTYYAESYLDNDGHDVEPLLGRLQLSVKNDTITVDLTGSSDQVEGPVNIGPAMALNSVATVIKAFFDPDGAINQGSFKPIKIINPPGSFLNARHPAPCGGMVECRALIAALVSMALGQALPEKRFGDLKGTGNHMYISGPIAGRGNYLLYEYPTGGTGGSRWGDGCNGVRAYYEGDFNAVWSIEVVEAQCGIQVESYGIREGSCGDGEFRGGCGISRRLRILSERANLSVLSDHCVIPPFGVAGGHSGATNRFSIDRGDHSVEPSPIPGKIAGFQLVADDIVRIETAGGGGYGDPLQRDPSRVLSDVKLGLITKEHAADRYGVVLTNDGLVDHDATEVKRKRIHQSRTMIVLEADTVDRFVGARRKFSVPVEVAEAKDIQAGSLLELMNPKRGAILRGWAEVVESGHSVAIGPYGMLILEARPGEMLELRCAPIR